MAQCKHMTDLAKDLLIQRDEAQAQNAALAVEVAMLKAVLTRVIRPYETESPHQVWEEARAALAAPAASGGEHGSALIEAADRMAESVRPAVVALMSYQRRWEEADEQGKHLIDLAEAYRRLRGASAASGQDAGEQGGEEITG